jgi:actin-like ATPase involved in cell morphogenesis
MLGKGLGYGYSMTGQLGAGSVSFEVSYGIDKEEQHGEAPHITLPGAGDEVDKRLLEAFKKSNTHLTVSLDDLRKTKEEKGFVGHFEEKVYARIGGQGRRGLDVEITSELGQACEWMAKRVCDDAIVPLLDQLPDTEGDALKNAVAEHIVLGGGGSSIKGLKGFVEQRVQALYPGAHVQILKDKVFGECVNSLAYVTSEHAIKKQYVQL